MLRPAARAALQFARRQRRGVGVGISNLRRRSRNKSSLTTSSVTRRTQSLQAVRVPPHSRPSSSTAAEAAEAAKAAAGGGGGGSPCRGEQREDLSRVLEVGREFSGFQVVATQRLEALNITAYLLDHAASGAKYLHLDAADVNNTFSIVLRTPPSDSTGVAHILEHLVLCGSEKYPVRDPFFNMLKRSLNTFMNAMTASDHTMYPFSTCHPADFANLLSVYTDAVFFPKLRELDFLQEGHRIQPSEKGSDYEYAGVVFNEMKGTLSDNATLFMTRMQEHLLKGTSYGVVSGGDPTHIPELTYEQLKDFHRACYHPSAALFFSYGDLSPLPHLEHLDQQCLQRLGYSERSASVAATKLPQAEKPSAREVVVERCNPDAMQGDVASQGKVALTGVLHDSHDSFKSLLMHITSTLLLSGPSAPMYQALIESDIAPAYAPGTGFDASSRNTTFTIGVEGVGEEKLDVVRQTIGEVMERAVTDPIDRARIAGVLHQFELGFKHKTGNFGLGLMYGVATAWAHGADILDALDVDGRLEQLKAADDEAYRQCLREIKAAVHDPAAQRAIELQMFPLESLAASQDAAEQVRLQETIKQFSDADRERVRRQAAELEKEQDAELDPSCLPTLSVNDIDPAILPLRRSTQVFSAGGHSERSARANVRVRQQPFDSNGVVYANLRLDSRHVSPHLKPYIPLLARVLGSVGAGDMGYREQALAIEQCCGGISVSVSRSASPFADSSQVHEGLMLQTYALERNFDQTLDMLHQIICAPRLDDVPRLRTLISSIAQRMSGSITRRGHSLALSDACASINVFNSSSNVAAGIPQVQFMQGLAAAGNDGAVLASEHLRELAGELLTLHAAEAAPELLVPSDEFAPGTQVPARQLDFEVPRQIAMLTTDEALLDSTYRAFEERLLSKLPVADGSAYPPQKQSVFDNAKQGKNRYLALPSNGVHFCAQAQPTFPSEDPRSAPLLILSSVLSSCYLHREVREKGGAYGAGCTVRSGALGMYSFYDPNTEATLAAFRQSIQWAADGGFEQRDLDESKLAIFADVDAPETPSSAGTQQWLNGTSDERRQARRTQLLECSAGDVQDVAAWLLDNNTGDAASVHTTIVGSDLTAGFQDRDGWVYENLSDKLDASAAE